jgi:hypothetical protein
MFRALLAHQEAVHKRHLLYCEGVMSVGCTCFTPILVQLTEHARNVPSVVCLAPPEDEQVMLEHVETINS